VASPDDSGSSQDGAQALPTAQAHPTGRQLASVLAASLLVTVAGAGQTSVGPALPRIIGELPGFDQSSWVVSVYLVTEVAVLLIVGRLSDQLSRKRFPVAGALIFLVGSGLAGMAWTMAELIVCRGIQGVGAGLLFAFSFALIRDGFRPAQRGKWQALCATAFWLSSMIGPLVGGTLTGSLGWRWVFYINPPIGGIAAALLVRWLPTST
jgi:MFS family permease